MQVEWYVAHAGQRPAEQLFSYFQKIINMHILAGSKLEINIGTALRVKILEVWSQVYVDLYSAHPLLSLLGGESRRLTASRRRHTHMNYIHM